MCWLGKVVEIPQIQQSAGVAREVVIPSVVGRQRAPVEIVQVNEVEGQHGGHSQLAPCRLRSWALLLAESSEAAPSEVRIGSPKRAAVLLGFPSAPVAVVFRLELLVLMVSCVLMQSNRLLAASWAYFLCTLQSRASSRRWRLFMRPPPVGNR